MRTLLLAIAVVALSSCALNVNMVDVEQRAIPGIPSDVATVAGKGTANGSNIIVLSFERSPISTNKDQKSTGEIPIGYNGGTAGAGSGGLTDVASKFAPDLSKTDSDNQTTSNPTSTTNNVAGDQTVKDEEAGSIPEVATGVEIPVDPAMVFNKEDTFNMYNVGDGGRHAWRIPKKGTDFGKTIKLEFEDGHEAIIPNTSVRFATKDGLIYRPGTGEKGTPTNELRTSHGGMYLYAPTGNKSKWVRIRY